MEFGGAGRCARAEGMGDSPLTGIESCILRWASVEAKSLEERTALDRAWKASCAGFGGPWRSIQGETYHLSKLVVADVAAVVMTMMVVKERKGK